MQTFAAQKKSSLTAKKRALLLQRRAVLTISVCKQQTSEGVDFSIRSLRKGQLSNCKLLSVNHFSKLAAALSTSQYDVLVSLITHCCTSYYSQFSKTCNKLSL